ncbi:Aquaporin SIP1.1 [Thalictrum thalictroides]|uniref:Aquaporin SIP1.1 n=1 Tax=Thalictrum thalictroides TaxID=46969 RepID=A0A7J6XDP8_THATH|nr:Aquaporin SIP1.1 [Thalictrum thalictroides]
MWIWSGALIKLFVFKYLNLGLEPKGEILKASLSIMSMFLFAWLSKITKGGSYNPLNLLSSAISGSFSGFLFIVGVRIPVQVIGSITAVKLILLNFPEVGRGPRLNVDIHRGALTEGLLTFTIVMISLGLSRNTRSGFFLKTWMSSVSKLTLHILGSDLTGGCMNPASAVGWAYAKGEHITKDHLVVYWLAPIEAALLSSWIFRLLVKPPKQEEVVEKTKSE